jgi:nucleoid-associated protein YgaU
MYEYVEKDRLDVLAHKFLNNPGLWHEILDINPEIINPNEIAPGTLLRIPNA